MCVKECVIFRSSTAIIYTLLTLNNLDLAKAPKDFKGEVLTQYLLNKFMEFNNLYFKKGTQLLAKYLLINYRIELKEDT